MYYNIGSIICMCMIMAGRINRNDFVIIAVRII